MEQKIDFFSNFLNKINNNLSKRHLKPIFSIRNNSKYNGEFNNISSNSSIINVKRFKTPLNSISLNNNKNKNISINIDTENERYKNKENSPNIFNKKYETKNTLIQNESKSNE